MDQAKEAAFEVSLEGMTPSAIVRYLDGHIVGQDVPKKIVAVAVYSHYRKLARSSSASGDIPKSNILLIGPTGTGKTLLCETLSRGLGVPFVTADATSLAQSRYVNEEIEAVLTRLVDKADGDLVKAQRGIVFIDEIDKLRADGGQAGGSSGERVQHALLKIMEGSRVRLGGSRSIDTTDILFICGGAFVGIENIIAKTHTFGFISTGDRDNQLILDRLNARIKPTDLYQFGLIPEFTGRLPIIATFQKLTKEMLVQIMIEPRNSIYNQFREMLGNEGVELVVEPAVFDEIADLAIEYKVGARSLRGIFQEMITPVLYAVPDRRDVRRVVIRSLFEEASLLTTGSMPTPRTPV
ncbi:MAG TPA: AAA family ATPase [Rhodocyclaceae bacterium]